MTSFFAWLDHSEHERRKMLDVIDLFREQETRDELGVGTIRDAIADLLFPGTSTIQTRARYFLFIPWIYKAIEQKHLSGPEAIQRARKDELALIQPLVDAGETDGVIGVEAREKLKRLPSAVYWQGLGSWGIRLFDGSQDRYHRQLDRLALARTRGQRDDDGEPTDGSARPSWDPRLPTAPPEFPKKTSFRLPRDEAEYLRDRVTTRWRDSFLAFLLDGEPWTPVALPWEHPRAIDTSLTVQEQLRHARLFSEVLLGAVLVYNLMLAEKAPSKNLEPKYRKDIEQWSGTVLARASEIADWDEARFWTIVRSRGARVGHNTQSFVSRWIALVRSSPKPVSLADATAARDFLHKRERQLKGEARLDNQRALERWGGAAGAGQMTFRWAKAERIALDIIEGLGAANA